MSPPASFLLAYRKSIALFILLVAGLILFPLWRDRVTADPLDVGIQLAPRGDVRANVRIVVPEYYQLQMVFFLRGERPLRELRALVGDGARRIDASDKSVPIPSGVRVPIRWTLHQMPGMQVVASGEVESYGTIGWSGGTIFRRVGGLQVPPGHYRFSAEILRDVPELAPFAPRLVLTMLPKASFTWQVDLALWGEIVRIFLLFPTAIVIGLVLLCRAEKWFCGKESP